MCPYYSRIQAIRTSVGTVRIKEKGVPCFEVFVLNIRHFDGGEATCA